MKYILLDTSIYENEGFNFNQGYLKIIETLCKNGDLKLFSHAIIEGEVKAHIIEKVNEFRIGVKSLKKLSYIFYNQASYKILKKFNEEWYDENSLLAYKNFLESSKPIMLGNNEISLDKLVNDYLKREPPFGIGKKKNEFPDAIILNALLKFEKKDRDEIYIISSDNDWIHFSEKYKIPCYNTIYGFMSEVMSEAEQNMIYTDAIKTWIANDKNKNLIEARLMTELDTMMEKRHDDYDEIEHDSLIKNLDDFECICFNLETKELSFQMTFDCDIKYLLSYEDYDNAIYEREDGKWYNLEYVTDKYEDSTIGVAVIGLKFDIKGERVIIKDFDAVEVLQLEDDEFKHTRIKPNYYYD